MSTTVMRPALTVALALGLLAAPLAAAAQQGKPDEQILQQPIRFDSGGVKLRAILARPQREGRFPAYIWTHGMLSAAQASRAAWKTLREGSHLQELARQGYVVLLVARRGHFGSEGTTDAYAGRTRLGPRALSARHWLWAAEAEAVDLIAARQYLAALPYVDDMRIAVGGVGYGGLMSLLAASRDPGFRAVVDMAGGFRAFHNSAEESFPLLDTVWPKIAEGIKAPVLILWSKNDRLDPEYGRRLEKALKKAGKPVEFLLYPAFRDNGRDLFFHEDGIPQFLPDLLRFLKTALDR